MRNGVTWIIGGKGSCIYCGEPFDDRQHSTGATRDHVIPKGLISAGGDYQPITGNLVLACGACNHLKRNHLPEGMRAMAEAHEKRALRLRQIADRAEQIIKERKLL